MAKRKYVPILNTLEMLLQGHLEEMLDVRLPDQPESDRAAYTRAARAWVGREALTPEERDRIQAVWLDGQWRQPMNVSRERREELRALIVPRSRREGRPSTEQLQAAMSGGES